MFADASCREVDLDCTPGSKSGDVAIDRSRCMNVLPVQVFIEGVRVHPEGPSSSIQGFEFARPDYSAIFHRVIERFDPETVACEQQATFGRIHDGERKHAAKMCGR